MKGIVLCSTDIDNREIIMYPESLLDNISYIIIDYIKSLFAIRKFHSISFYENKILIYHNTPNNELLLLFFDPNEKEDIFLTEKIYKEIKENNPLSYISKQNSSIIIPK